MTAVPYILLVAVVIANVFLFFFLKRNRCASKNDCDTPPELQEVVNQVKKEVKELNEIITNLKVSSQPSIQLIPEVTPVSEVDINDVSFADEPEPIASGISIAELEAALRNIPDESEYRITYLHDPVNLFKASNGKQVYIRADYHRKISFLLSAAECGCNTITGFLDNLLTEHFVRNSASVNTILDSRYKNANSL
ncbi:MAG: DUF3408 domain-containing protein [Muribaculum sp.]|uniref:DUF3408 domain-containing protein n=1 Tax=Duncaniella dubosii TaxID=2518971 RepID=UPI0035287B2B|nr:DUF3408 domain-containing protein [Muribaculum sp.]